MRFCGADFDEMDKLIDFPTRGSILSTLRNLTGIAESRITEFVKALRNFEKGDDPKIDGTILFYGCRCPKNTKVDEKRCIAGSVVNGTKLSRIFDADSICASWGHAFEK